MKRSTVLAAVLGAVLAGSGTTYYYQHTRQTDLNTADFVTLALDVAQSGEIRRNSFVNFNTGARSALFVFNAEAHQRYKIEVTGALRAQLSVFDQHFLIATSQASQADQKNTSMLAFEAEHRANYAVIVSGVDANAYGPFQVLVSPIQSYVNQTVRSHTHTTEIASGHAQTFILNVEESALYTITMQGLQGDLDPYLTLFEANGRERQSDDDSGGGLDATIHGYLEPGSYTIQASSALGDKTFNGVYRL